VLASSSACLQYLGAKQLQNMHKQALFVLPQTVVLICKRNTNDVPWGISDAFEQLSRSGSKECGVCQEPGLWSAQLQAKLPAGLYPSRQLDILADKPAR
jgi:hypothetical protein